MSIQHSPRVMKDAEDFLIRACGCGVIHLNFGAINISATPETVIAIAEKLNEVAHTLEKDRHLDDPVNAHQASIAPDGSVTPNAFPHLLRTISH